MPKQVEFTGLGLINFPEDWSQEQIEDDVRQNFDLYRNALQQRQAFEREVSGIERYQRGEVPMGEQLESAAASFTKATLAGVGAVPAQIGRYAEVLPPEFSTFSEFGGMVPISREEREFIKQQQARRAAETPEQKAARFAAAPAVQLGQAIAETPTKYQEQPGVARSFWLGQVPSGVGSTVPALGVGILPGGQEAAVAMMFAQEADDAYESEIQRQRDAGETPDPEKAMAKAVLYGTGATGIEFGLGTGRILRRIRRVFGGATKEATDTAIDAAAKTGRLRGILNTAAKDTLAGFSEEASQRALQDVIVHGRVNVGAALQEGAVGAVLEPVMGGPANVAEHFFPRSTATTQDMADQMRKSGQAPPIVDLGAPLTPAITLTPEEIAAEQQKVAAEQQQAAEQQRIAEEQRIAAEKQQAAPPPPPTPPAPTTIAPTTTAPTTTEAAPVPTTEGAAAAPVAPTAQATTATVTPNVPANLANLPSWLQDETLRLAGEVPANVADQIEELAAQRLTAKQIAQRLGLEIKNVVAVRLVRGIPSMGPAGVATLGGAPAGGEETAAFEAWLARRAVRPPPTAAVTEAAAAPAAAAAAAVPTAPTTTEAAPAPAAPAAPAVPSATAETAAALTPAGPTPTAAEVPTAAAPAPQAAESALNQAKREFREALARASAPGIAADPRQMVEIQLNLYRALFNLAKEYVKAGAKSFADFLTKYGLTDSLATRHAYDRAVAAQPDPVSITDLPADVLADTVPAAARLVGGAPEPTIGKTTTGFHPRTPVLPGDIRRRSLSTLHDYEYLALPDNVKDAKTNEWLSHFATPEEAMNAIGELQSGALAADAMGKITDIIGNQLIRANVADRLPLQHQFERAVTMLDLYKTEHGQSLQAHKGVNKLLEPLSGLMSYFKLGRQRREKIINRRITPEQQGKAVTDIKAGLVETAVDATNAIDPNEPRGILKQLLTYLKRQEEGARRKTRPAPTEEESRTVLDRINAMFPLANWRELFTKKGSADLAKRFFQLMAGPREKAGHVYTFEGVVRTELGRILNQAMAAAGFKPAEGPKGLSTAERIAQFIGDDPLRSDKLKLIDEAVSKDIQSRPEGPERDQLQDLWDKMVGLMSSAPAAQTTLRRLGHEILKNFDALFPEVFPRPAGEDQITPRTWDDIFTGRFHKNNPDLALSDLRTRFLDELTTRIQQAATNTLDLGPLRDAAGRVFDSIAEVQRQRHEGNLLSKRANEAYRQTIEPEKQAEAIINEFSRVQSDTPDFRKAKPKPIREALKQFLKGEIDAPTLLDRLMKLGVLESTAQRVLSVAQREADARRMANWMQELKRLVQEVLDFEALFPEPGAARTQPRTWDDIFTGRFTANNPDVSLKNLRDRVVDTAAARLQAAATNQLDLGPFREALGRAFDSIAEVQRQRHEGKLLSKRASEAYRQTIEPEKQAEAIINEFSRVQTDTPEFRKAKRKPLRKVIRQFLEGKIDAPGLLDRLMKLGVLESTAQRVLSVAQREADARRMANWMHERDKFAAFIKNDKAVSRLLAKIAGKLDIDFSDLFQVAGPTEVEKKRRIFEKIRNDDRFAKLTLQEKAELTDGLHAAWERARQDIFYQEFGRLVPLPRVDPDARERISASLPQIVRYANLGLLNQESFRNAVAKKFGVASLEDETAHKLGDLAKKYQQVPDGFQRTRVLKDMDEVLRGDKNLTAGSLAQDAWYSNVLSGIRTFVDVVLGTYANGMINTTLQAVDMAVSGNPRLAVHSLTQYLRAIPTGLHYAAHVIKTGDTTLLPAAQERYERMLQGKETSETLELARKASNLGVRALGQLSLFRRLMVGLDYAGNYPTRQAALPYIAWVRRTEKPGQLDAVVKAQDVQANKSALAQARSELGADASNLEVKTRARELLEQSIDDDIKEGATLMGSRAALNAEPTGIGSIIYGNAVKRLPFIFKGVIGASFARAAINMVSMAANFTPLVGQINSLRAFAGQANYFKALPANSPMRGLMLTDIPPEQRRLIHYSQLSGLATLLGAAGMWLGSDEPDDERYSDITGTWYGLTPQQKSQLRAQGQRPLSIRVGDRWITYRNLPVAGALAIVGNMRDKQHYQGKKYSADDIVQQVTDSWIGALTYFMDLPMVDQLAEIVGKSSIRGAGEAEEFEKRAGSAVARFGAGFIPAVSLLREVDTMQDPNLYRPGQGIEYLLRNIPFARRTIGPGPAVNALGEDINIGMTPFSRWLSEVPDDPVWRLVTKNAAQGVWTPLQSRSAQIIGRNGLRRTMTPEEFYTYQKSAGQLWYQQLKQNLPYLQSLTPQQFDRWLDARVESINRAARFRVRPSE